MTLTRTLKTLGLLAVSALAALAIPNATAQGYIAKYNFMWDLSSNEEQSGNLLETPPLQGYKVQNNFMRNQSTNGGQPGILVTIPPVVTAVAPSNTASAVPINTMYIVASFNEPMLRETMFFTMTCFVGTTACAVPTGTFALNYPNDDIATFTLTTGTTLVANAVYTATVVNAYSRTNGEQLGSFGWTFTAGATTSKVSPTVVSTIPATTIPGPTPNVPTNSAIAATFSKPMAPASINGSSFSVKCSLPCTNPTGTVSYSVGSNTAVFTPAVALQPGVTYTATITTGATDLQGNALTGNPAGSSYSWTFTTVSAVSPGDVSVASTNPAGGDTQVCSNASVNATFGLLPGYAMDPATVNPATFTVTDSGLIPVLATSVALDSTGTIATFVPAVLTPGVTYTAMIKGGAIGVKDLAIPADIMPNDFSWSFTTIDCTVPTAPQLGAASTFGVLIGSVSSTVTGVINQGTKSFINGNLGARAASTTVTGLHDSVPNCIYTETAKNKGVVTGLIYTDGPSPAGCPSEGTTATRDIAIAATTAADTAYKALAAAGPALPITDGDLGSLPGPLVPGVYTSTTDAFTIKGADLTLDAQGDPTATWIFQTNKGALVVGDFQGAHRNVNLINGAQAKNVFWQIGGAVSINDVGGGTMVGTIIAQNGIAISKGNNPAVVNSKVATLYGRALSLGKSVELVNTVINVPAP